jgi:hypothetical protein
MLTQDAFRRIFLALCFTANLKLVDTQTLKLSDT